MNKSFNKRNAIDIKDKNGNVVYFGDKFLAKMIKSSSEKGTIVTVVEDLITKNKRFSKKIDMIKKKNDNLIAYWKSIPWWKFWAKPSFEEQRKIIISNWDSI